jgi:hypothetical protein
MLAVAECKIRVQKNRVHDPLKESDFVDNQDKRGALTAERGAPDVSAESSGLLRGLGSLGGTLLLKLAMTSTGEFLLRVG